MAASRQIAYQRLTDRDERVVQHVGRNRLTTREILRRVVLPELSPNGLSKLANRLCQRDLLRKYPLFYPAQYFVLGEAAARLLGLGLHRVAPLGPQALPVEYAVLAHAALGKVNRTRLTTEETLSRYPWLSAELSEPTHCLDERNQVLELVRVDLGGPADHVARKCARDITRRRRLPEFTSFVAHGRFRLVVITATREKAAAVRQALDRHDWPAGLLIHLSVVPKLLSLLASRNHA